jgi:hypothetical protein
LEERGRKRGLIVELTVFGYSIYQNLVTVDDTLASLDGMTYGRSVNIQNFSHICSAITQNSYGQIAIFTILYLIHNTCRYKQ